ncbi:Galactose-3-O-sulfotransferase, partial [Trinorchestia longiramus]
MFLKTHKCASSSVQNMFLRYGISHNLTFALSAAGNYLGNPRPFMAGMVNKELLPPDGVVDLFAVHTRLNPSEHRKILHPDTVFVTVVRDPALLFESLYNYFRLSKHFNGSQLEEFLNFPLKTQMELRKRGGRFGHDMMLFDMGTDVQADMTVVDIRRAIDNADEIFDLVLIAEKMDESLILLKKLLCWDYQDLVFFSKNARREDMKSDMSVSALQRMRELNSGDALLYDHFLAQHDQMVLRYGTQKMADEVATLRALREEMFEYCGTHVVAGFAPDHTFKEYSSQVNGYVPDKKEDLTCLMLSLPELSALAKIRAYQRELIARMRATEETHQASFTL